MARKSIKYYGIRRGKRVGVVSSWAKCLEFVKGVARAEYRKFSTVEEARAWLAEGEAQAKAEARTEAPAGGVDVWADGSLRGKAMAYGAHYAGGGLCGPGREAIRDRFGPVIAGSTPSSSLAEMCGAIAALRALPESGAVVLHIDNDGVRNWWTGSWKAREPGIRRALELMREAAARHGSVTVVPVDGHSGDPPNEHADRLAGLGHARHTKGFQADLRLQ